MKYLFILLLVTASMSAIAQQKLSDNFPPTLRFDKVPGERLTDLCLNESNKLTLEFHRGNDKEIWMNQDYKIDVYQGKADITKISSRVFDVKPTSTSYLKLDIYVKLNKDVLYPVPKSGNILDEVTDDNGKVIESKVKWTAMTDYVDNTDESGMYARNQTITYRVKQCN